MSQLTILTLEKQSQTKDLLKTGFAGITLQNAELLDQNQHLKD